MNGFTISMNTAHYHFAIFIFQCCWLHITFAATLGGFLPCTCCIFNFQAPRLYTITMFVNMISDFIFVLIGVVNTNVSLFWLIT